ncbi:unnamed protein product [Sphagnum tenellum]
MSFHDAHSSLQDGVHKLLSCPSPCAMQRYYEQLSTSGLGPGLQVRYIGGEMGKGVFAVKDFNVEEVVLQEPMLVGAQHSSNKVNAMVCSYCFRYVGSLELQLARRLLHQEGDSVGDEEGSEKDMDRDEDVGHYMDEEEERDMTSHMDEDNENCGCERSTKPKKALPPEALAALASGGLQLPHVEHFVLPPVVKCKGGCSEDIYCSDACAEAAWEAYHSLLCSGPLSLCKNIDALSSFKQFADETNDIFHIAAQVVAATILRAWKLENEKSGTVAISSSRGISEATMLKAWEPFAMGYKQLWWQTVALPADVEPSNEQEFRNQMKEIAAHSLSLLKQAIYKETFSPLFTLDVYGHIIGMFELNNLEIVVASPVEDYFLYINDLPPEAKAQAGLVTKVYLDALGDDYAAYCQGSAFFALQSCINHSCTPNAKAFKRDQDNDGQAVLLATRHIRRGEEITISYIDEDSSLEERKAALADYGFTCRCLRCLQES